MVDAVRPAPITSKLSQLFPNMQDCCLRGFKWDGTPKGTESKLGKHDVYVAGTNEARAVMMVHDAYGWTFRNARLMADHYAAEADVTVYLPDL